MALDFAIDTYRNEKRLQFNLVGNFDRGSASQLIEALKENRQDVSVVVIETTGLVHVSPSGKKLFQEKAHTLSDFCYRLVFTGKNAGELALPWTYCY